MGYPTDFISAVTTLRSKLTTLEESWVDFTEGNGTPVVDLQDVADDIDALWDQYVSLLTHWNAYRTDSSFKNLDTSLKTNIQNRFNKYIDLMKGTVHGYVGEGLYFETWGSSWGDTVYADITNSMLRNNLQKGFYKLYKRGDNIITLMERYLGKIS
jgi:hypothetical protein